MSSLSRLKASPALVVRALVALAAAGAIAAAVTALATGRVSRGAGFAQEILVLAVVGALARRYGIPLPGKGFTSYILGVTAYAILDRGWPLGVLVAPAAMITGDLALRRLPAATALDNAAHLTAGSAVAGLAYARLGGTTGPDALAPDNLLPLVTLLVLLPCIVNGTFYLQLALGRAIAWVDARLTARWEAVVYVCSFGLALGWLAVMHANVGGIRLVGIGAALLGATVASGPVIRRAVRADELALIQDLSQAIARDISLAKSFQRIQELARRLVPWEHMGFARYDAASNEMELVADTAATDHGRFRFDALPPRKYRLRITPVPNRRATTPVFYDLTLPAAASRSRTFGQTYNILISGRVFEDLNSNGVIDAGEVGLASVTVFVDADNDGVPDSDELSVLTDAAGRYAITALPSGTFNIRVHTTSSSANTVPGSGRRTVTLSSGQVAANVNLGQRRIA